MVEPGLKSRFSGSTLNCSTIWRQPKCGSHLAVEYPPPTEPASWKCRVDHMEGTDDHGQGPPWPALCYFEMIQGEEIGCPLMVLSWAHTDLISCSALGGAASFKLSAPFPMATLSASFTHSDRLQKPYRII